MMNAEKPEAVESAVNVTEPLGKEADTGASIWLTYAITVLIAVVVCVLALATYHYLIAKEDRQRLAMVDINEVLELKQLQMTVGALQPGVTDKDRERMFEEIQAFAKKLEEGVKQLQGECGCTLLVRAAVVNPQGLDLTDRLKEVVGVAGLDAAALARQVKESPFGGAPQTEENKQ